MDTQENATLSLLQGSAPPPSSAEVQINSQSPEPAKKNGKAKGGKGAKAKAGTEVVVAEQAQEGEILGPDLITDTVKEIENLSEEQAKPLALELIGKSDFNSFKLGGVLARIMENKWFAPAQDFKSFVEAEYGFSVRKAFYLISLYKGLCNLGLPWEDLKQVGWNKLKELVPVINNDNAQEWLAKAADPSMTVLKLAAAVADAKKAIDAPADAPTEASQPVVKKTFSLHSDQQQSLQQALEKAKKASGTDVDTVALDYIMLDYLGNTEKPKVDNKALSAGLDNEAPAAAGGEITEAQVKAYLKNVAKVQGSFKLFGELWPTIEVEVSIPDDFPQEELGDE